MSNSKPQGVVKSTDSSSKPPAMTSTVNDRVTRSTTGGQPKSLGPRCT